MYGNETIKWDTGTFVPKVTHIPDEFGTLFKIICNTL